MTPIFPHLPHTLGVYSLTRHLETRENTELYEARQTHVDRAVVLEVLRPGASQAEEAAFLTQARHRVATDGMPHVADVYESLRAEGIWFLTQELPPGDSLADIAEAGRKLQVPDICRVISAAAEMYDMYLQAGHHAMPLEPTSVYVEESGEVHFLSPLVEGVANKPRKQMHALARILRRVVPVIHAPGLGRVTTLIHWLKEGADGVYLTWPEIKETADTILQQLETNALPEHEKSAFTRLCERVNSHPFTQRIRNFFRHWGLLLAVSAGTIVLLSSIGRQFGMDTPTYLPPLDLQALHCQENEVCERVLRQPVSVQQYADFMQAFRKLEPARREELLRDMPEQDISLIPADWKDQLATADPGAPVTGVNYQQALLYARAAGGALPTACQLQAMVANALPLTELEWTRSQAESPLPGIYDGTVYLLVDQQGEIFPTDSPDWQDSRCGFRIALPETPLP